MFAAECPASPGVDHAAAASSAFDTGAPDEEEEKLEGDELEGDEGGVGVDNDVEGDGDELSEDEIKVRHISSCPEPC